MSASSCGAQNELNVGARLVNSFAAIHDFTGGVSRQINNLATACLLQGTARKVMRIDDALFQQAVGEFQLP